MKPNLRERGGRTRKAKRNVRSRIFTEPSSPKIEREFDEEWSLLRHSTAENSSHPIAHRMRFRLRPRDRLLTVCAHEADSNARVIERRRHRTNSLVILVFAPKTQAHTV